MLNAFSVVQKGESKASAPQKRLPGPTYGQPQETDIKWNCDSVRFDKQFLHTDW